MFNSAATGFGTRDLSANRSWPGFDRGREKFRLVVTLFILHERWCFRFLSACYSPTLSIAGRQDRAAIRLPDSVYMGPCRWSEFGRPLKQGPIIVAPACQLVSSGAFCSEASGRRTPKNSEPRRQQGTYLTAARLDLGNLGQLGCRLGDPGCQSPRYLQPVDHPKRCVPLAPMTLLGRIREPPQPIARKGRRPTLLASIKIFGFRTRCSRQLRQLRPPPGHPVTR